MNGSVLTGTDTAAFSRCSWSRWERERRYYGERGAHGGSGGAVGILERPFELGRLALGESLGIEGVHVDALDRLPMSLVSDSSSEGGLVDGHLLGQRDDRHARGVVIGD